MTMLYLSRAIPPKAGPTHKTGTAILTKVAVFQAYDGICFNNHVNMLRIFCCRILWSSFPLRSGDDFDMGDKHNRYFHKRKRN